MPSPDTFSNVCACVRGCTQSCLFVTPWTIARQAPLSTGFPRQEHWNGLPFLFPGDLPHSGIQPASFTSPELQADSSLLSHRGSSYPLAWRPTQPWVITSVGEDVEKREPLLSAVGTENWCSHYEEHEVWRFFKKLKVELSHDLATPSLSACLKNMKLLSWGGVCTAPFTAALSATAKTREQPRCARRRDG